MERIENAIIIIWDLEVITSLGLFGCADNVSKPSKVMRVCTFSKEPLLV